MRKFLVLLDDSRECLNAMRFAAMRASNTGGAVVVLAVISAAEIQHGLGVAEVMRAELRERISHESISKGMIPKLRACADAVEGGVGSAHIIDGRVAHALLIEILTDKGIGTMIKP